ASPCSVISREIIRSFVLCGAVLWLVQHMTPSTWLAGARNAHDYLITQPYVALLYTKKFFWPISLSADYDLNPFQTTDAALFWVGFAFLVMFVAAAIAASAFRRPRLIGFGLLWFLIALLPTSLLPLAEVMNDHRTFLPYIGLVIALAGAAELLLSHARRAQQIAAACAAAVILCASGCATWQRNKVWRTEETLWRDVTIKSPRNGRGLMNNGNVLMARGDYGGALDYFHRALVLDPQYPVLFINLGIAEAAAKHPAVAELHFKEALRLAPSMPDSYTYYARYLIAHSRQAEARGLLQDALLLSPGDLMARNLLAKTRGGAAIPKAKNG
ncbi:MAG: tetratricopeptide repeat protein, partial [Bryobacteraceae bacterium]